MKEAEGGEVVEAMVTTYYAKQDAWFLLCRSCKSSAREQAWGMLAGQAKGEQKTSGKASMMLLIPEENSLSRAVRQETNRY